MSPNPMMPPKLKAVCLLSGGLDSTMSLVAGLAHYDVVLAITFNYGQRAYGKELRAARALAEFYAVRHQVIALPWVSDLLPEAMSSHPGVQRQVSTWDETGPENDSFFEPLPVWVPNRNGLFINAAATFAEALGAQVVLFGANAEEAERFPDNTETFRQAINESLSWSTLNGVRVEAPMALLDKPQIVAQAHQFNVPLNLIWSCYGDGVTQCGRCPSCFRLKNALAHTPAMQAIVSF